VVTALPEIVMVLDEVLTAVIDTESAIVVGEATVPMSMRRPTNRWRIWAAVVVEASCTVVEDEVVPHWATTPFEVPHAWRQTSRPPSLRMPDISFSIESTKDAEPPDAWLMRGRLSSMRP